MADTESLSWNQLLRYRLIEILAYWEGRVNTTHLVNAFDISRQTASMDINHYKARLPQNLTYNASTQGYGATDQFSPEFTCGQIDEYFQFLNEQNSPNQHFKSPVFKTANVHHLQPPARNINLPILRCLIQACRDQRRVGVHYASLKNPESEFRLIVPHTLIHSGLRWSVRAYCEKNKMFVDFVLSRFRGEVSEDEGDTLRESTIEYDTDWNTEVMIEITPTHRLTPAQQRVIAGDYGMTDGLLEIPTRGPLVQYTLDLLNIDTKSIKQDPAAQQVEIRNWHDIQKWLWG